MDSFSKISAVADPGVQSDDVLIFEMRNNYYQAFSPVSDATEGNGEITAATRSVEVSESPSPDMVQDAYDRDEDIAQLQEIKWSFDSDAVTSHTYVQQLGSSNLFSDVNRCETDPRPISLPDVLKSFPLNPDKVDSGSSEGSPDCSPVHRSGNDSPNSPFSVSANKQIGFDSNILLLKEMAEETETKAAEKAKLEAEKAKLEAEKISKQNVVAFDLVTGMVIPPRSGKPLKEKDAEILSQMSVSITDKFQCFNFPTGQAQEPLDSESPSTDSFSSVFDSVAKKTSGFSVKQENPAVKEEIDEAVDEVSEQEVSSEEFEFVERPSRGVPDEFLKMYDSLMKQSKMLVDEFTNTLATNQMSTSQHAKEQSSHHLLSPLSDESFNVRDKASLESDFQEISSASLMYTPVDQTGVENMKPKVHSIASLRTAAVLNLLYWRDVRSSAVVFISSLVVLLSISACSIISVLSYLMLSLLSVTVPFRIFKGIQQAYQKSDEGHPFKQFLDKDVALSKELVQKYSDMALCRINSGLIELRRLFLVENLVDSLKFAVFLWILTYVGAVFNGLTFLIIDDFFAGLVGAFSCPVLYEKNQAELNQYTFMLNNQIKDILAKFQVKVPAMKLE